MFQKLLSIALLSFALTSCGNPTTQSTEQSDSTATIAQDTDIFARESVAAANNDNIKLQVPYRISIWLQSEIGYEEYGNPSNFLNFTTETNLTEQQKLYDGLTFLFGKIYGSADPRPEKYLFIKSVKGGKAGAVYTYPVPAIQNPTSIANLKHTIIETVNKWCNDNKQKMNTPVDNPDSDRILVITIDTKK